MDWNNIDWLNLDCEIVDGDFSLGTYVTVRIGDETFTRKVYNDKDDLHIIVNNYRFSYQDFVGGR